jgi:tRNA nucleotidyltransferase (CCA-adding enzyme)
MSWYHDSRRHSLASRGIKTTRKRVYNHMSRSTIDYLRGKGGKVYLVGGKVRDDMLKKPSKDTDYLITGIPKDKLEQYLSKRGHVVTDKNMGVFKFKDAQSNQKLPDDIVLPRTEKPTGGGKHRDFIIEYDSSLPVEKDLSRRDFTINAMAKDASTGEIIDPYGGSKDLKKKKIRLVNPDAFKDDPLRMLRAGQFASRFDADIDEETKKELKRMAPQIKKEPPERIAEEFRKGFGKGDNPEKMWDALYETGVLQEVIPELKPMKNYEQNDYHVYKLDKHTRETIKEMGKLTRGRPQEERFKLVMAGMLHDIGKPDALTIKDGKRHFYNHEIPSTEKTKEILKRLKLSKDEQRDILLLVENHDIFRDRMGDAHVRRVIHELGPQRVNDLLLFRKADMRAHGKKHHKEIDKDVSFMEERVKKNIPLTYSKKDLAIQPTEMMNIYKIPPQEIGEIQDKMQKGVLSNPRLNTKKELKQYIPGRYRKHVMV